MMKIAADFVYIGDTKMYLLYTQAVYLSSCVFTNLK